VLLLVDNYDSFTWNLVQRFAEIAPSLAVEVVRNDAIDVARAEAMSPTHLVVSPGPCTPAESGASRALLAHYRGRIPALGVCLGHQAIGHVYGGSVVRAPELMHGKTSHISHRDTGVFSGVANPVEATRYHSLVVEREGLPACLEVTAETADGMIMGLRHRDVDVEGVQFHPESVLTSAGHQMLANFLARCSH